MRKAGKFLSHSKLISTIGNALGAAGVPYAGTIGKAAGAIGFGKKRQLRIRRTGMGPRRTGGRRMR
jgi:hypothetical protein